MANQYYPVTVDTAEAQRLSDLRGNGKEGYASTRRLTQHGYHYVGAAGELAVENYTGLPADRSQRTGGDGGVDFTAVLHIDVKTTVYPHAERCALLVEDGKVTANVYILAQLPDPKGTTVNLLGWVWGYEVAKARLDADGTRFRHGIRNRYLYQNELRDMAELHAILTPVPRPTPPVVAEEAVPVPDESWDDILADLF